MLRRTSSSTGDHLRRRGSTLRSPQGVVFLRNHRRRIGEVRCDHFRRNPENQGVAYFIITPSGDLYEFGHLRSEFGNVGLGASICLRRNSAWAGEEDVYIFARDYFHRGSS